VIPRVWVCTDQPLALELLSKPLHPLLLLALLMLWGFLKVAERPQAVTATLRALGVLSGTLVFLAVAFFAVAWFVRSFFDPTPLLSSARWAWAVAGPIALAVAIWRARGALVSQANESPESGQAENPTTAEASPLAPAVVIFLSCGLSALIVAGYVSPDANSEGLSSIPYRLFEWGVADELGPATDECLALRAIEYGTLDRIGLEAMNELSFRKGAATAGVRAQLDVLRAHWPPPPKSTTDTGIGFLLGILARYGDSSTVKAWEKLNWRQTQDSKKPLEVLTP
jgi:hypothetical protein